MHQVLYGFHKRVDSTVLLRQIDVNIAKKRGRREEEIVDALETLLKVHVKFQ